jgi:segregation and condensation protein B
MERSLQKQVIEAFLFLKEEPVKVDLIADLLAVPVEEARTLIAELQADLDAAARGIRIYEVAGGFQMGTRPELARYLEAGFGEEGAGSLSPAAMETLAIIAYKQPVTRMDIESVRGVKCDHVLENLLKRKLIRISGRKEGPGRPLIYATSPDFLKYFGLKDLNDLPPLTKNPAPEPEEQDSAPEEQATGEHS